MRRPPTATIATSATSSRCALPLPNNSTLSTLLRLWLTTWGRVKWLGSRRRCFNHSLRSASRSGHLRSQASHPRRRWLSAAASLWLPALRLPVHRLMPHATICFHIGTYIQRSGAATLAGQIPLLVGMRLASASASGEREAIR
jgi:hypothetical protein